uniref:Uncharacterized protein n=1 Tax=Chromera velia CCMP2878 TaxID=1169474 RepID=A0A0G4FTY1_9ALVE|mmetsp:Transcript_24619/g.48309  ORF Transcript_24619/g.48309 Transcript_24619/m.48309 type:complete len:220 (-) Transcript_24619:613-1272(-)|eukprot:Cvel_18636.t1-p1 / transcript=Cvel_18636.t1 / gene=Cvel_18636 / organism=Chromera_velia_CCMP2878 / gene_product=hypothetical protein / transcript_product=hypothetical protein / location=Cvel_scaffold1556:35585-36707(+) / protein_length=219 / sequence_SO=supercontig / SO=protein_coding / is_pseudo=false
MPTKSASPYKNAVPFKKNKSPKKSPQKILPVSGLAPLPTEYGLAKSVARSAAAAPAPAAPPVSITSLQTAAETAPQVHTASVPTVQFAQSTHAAVPLPRTSMVSAPMPMMMPPPQPMMMPPMPVYTTMPSAPEPEIATVKTTRTIVHPLPEPRKTLTLEEWKQSEYYTECYASKTVWTPVPIIQTTTSSTARPSVVETVTMPVGVGLVDFRGKPSCQCC